MFRADFLPFTSKIVEHSRYLPLGRAWWWGNFGIVTAFEFQLHAVGAVLAGKVVYPMSRAREVLRFYREYTSCISDELTAYACLLTSAFSRDLFRDG